MAVAEWAGGVSNVRLALEGLKDFVAPAFRRSEQRASASVVMDGLLSGVERKTGGCWRKRPVLRGPAGSNPCLAGRAGRRMRCVIGFGAMRWTHLVMRMAVS